MIAVVGAGIAGCRAANLLASGGADVVVIEASDRIGGKIWTQKFESGGFWEGGGEWIDNEHKRALEAIQQFGSGIEISSQYPGRLVWRDQVAKESRPWPIAAKDEERFYEAVFSDSPDADIDVASLIEGVASSEEGKWLIEARIRSDEGTDASELGLRAFRQGQELYLRRTGGEMSSMISKDSLQRVCEQMLRVAGIDLCLRQRVVSVRRRESQFTVQLADGHEIHCDEVIFAVPPKALAKIEFATLVPHEVIYAIQSVRQGSIVKTAYKFQVPFWLEQYDSARVLTDKWIQQVWDESREGSYALCGYTCGRAAEMLNDESALTRGLNDIEELFPGSRVFFMESMICDWRENGFSYLPPGIDWNDLEILKRPHDGLHFAGEFVSTWTGFIEGALESAERVVEEIIHTDRTELHG